MQEGMQSDPIQGQGQGHEPFKVGNLAKTLLLLLLPHTGSGAVMRPDSFVDFGAI